MLDKSIKNLIDYIRLKKMLYEFFIFLYNLLNFLY